MSGHTYYELYCGKIVRSLSHSSPLYKTVEGYFLGSVLKKGPKKCYWGENGLFECSEVARQGELVEFASGCTNPDAQQALMELEI